MSDETRIWLLRRKVVDGTITDKEYEEYDTLSLQQSTQQNNAFPALSARKMVRFAMQVVYALLVLTFLAFLVLLLYIVLRFDTIQH